MAKGKLPESDGLVPALLRHLRQEAELTQRDVAARMKRTQPWVHKSEIGERRVDVSEFLDWCVACRSDPHEALRRLIKQRR
jgi:transcriptional regulator with XRE-family HTH domain